MLLMVKPPRDVTADYDFARSKRRAPTTRQLLASARKRVLAAYHGYAESGPSQLIPLNLSDTIDAALEANYQLTYADGPLSSLRDVVLAAAPYGLCPMCGRASASTLDHYLPKVMYPEFSILADNLVPACADCNFKKRSFVGTSDSGRFLHAYFDRLDESCALLTARVGVDSGELGVEFFINDRLPHDTYSNATIQFQILNLAVEYSLAARIELVERLEMFRETYRSGGSEAVSAASLREAKNLRKKFGAHYWKVALYDALRTSDDFCDGGFEMLESE